MNKIIRGKAFVLGNNIDTDQIIPAEHLVYSLTDEKESKKYGEFALSGVPLIQAGLPNGNIKFVESGNYKSEYNIIIGGSNFGCGSSREHAPFALQVAGVQAIVAESYARIFYRNSVDGGFLIPLEGNEKLNGKIVTGDEIEVDLANDTIRNLTDGNAYQLRPLGSAYDIVKSGGLFNYARENNMI